MKNLLHKIAHWLHLNFKREVIVFNQSKGMEMTYRNECLKCGKY